jgi:hypothetical protein
MPSTPTEAKHTPTPWAVGEGYEIYAVDEYRSVAMVFGDERMEANAAFIVQCVNERSSLLSLIEDMAKALEPFADVAQFYDPPEGDDHEDAWDHEFTMGNLRRARSALSRYTEFMEQNNG